MVNIETIKKIREKTGLAVFEIKKAIKLAKGDEQKALQILKKKEDAIVKTKSSKQTTCGLIESYTHPGGQIGVLVEVGCQSDFVAKNKKFQNLVHDLALQVASMAPKSISQLLKQPFIKDEKMTISDLIEKHIALFGENIKILRFTRYRQGSLC